MAFVESHWASLCRDAVLSADKQTPEIGPRQRERQGWKPNGQDREAGLVHASPARSDSAGRRPN